MKVSGSEQLNTHNAHLDYLPKSGHTSNRAEDIYTQTQNVNLEEKNENRSKFLPPSLSIPENDPTNIDHFESASSSSRSQYSQSYSHVEPGILKVFQTFDLHRSGRLPRVQIIAAFEYLGISISDITKGLCTSNEQAKIRNILSKQRNSEEIPYMDIVACLSYDPDYFQGGISRPPRVLIRAPTLGAGSESKKIYKTEVPPIVSPPRSPRKMNKHIGHLSMAPSTSASNIGLHYINIGLHYISANATRQLHQGISEKESSLASLIKMLPAGTNGYRIIKALRKFDNDRDGKVTYSEFERAMINLGIKTDESLPHVHITNGAVIAKIARTLDTDKDGLICTHDLFKRGNLDIMYQKDDKNNESPLTSHNSPDKVEAAHAVHTQKEMKSARGKRKFQKNVNITHTRESLFSSLEGKRDSQLFLRRIQERISQISMKHKKCPYSTIFTLFDQNNDGTVTKPEFGMCIENNLGIQCRNSKMLNDIWNCIDKNNDGSCDLTELVMFLEGFDPKAQEEDTKRCVAMQQMVPANIRDHLINSMTGLTNVKKDEIPCGKKKVSQKSFDGHKTQFLSWNVDDLQRKYNNTNVETKNKNIDADIVGAKAFALKRDQIIIRQLSAKLVGRSGSFRKTLGYFAGIYDGLHHGIVDFNTRDLIHAFKNMGITASDAEFHRLCQRLIKTDGVTIDVHKLQALCELENVGKLAKSPPPLPKFHTPHSSQISLDPAGRPHVDRGKRMTDANMARGQHTHISASGGYLTVVHADVPPLNIYQHKDEIGRQQKLAQNSNGNLNSKQANTNEISSMHRANISNLTGSGCCIKEAFKNHINLSTKTELIQKCDSNKPMASISHLFGATVVINNEKSKVTGKKRVPIPGQDY